MGADFTDDEIYQISGVFYPRGHVFAMFSDLDALRIVSADIADLEGIGQVQVLSSDVILEGLAERAERVGGLPSVGRERQFMVRFVELATQGLWGLLIEVADADVDAISTALKARRAELAYHYRLLVIEELVDSTPRAQAAAAGTK